MNLWNQHELRFMEFDDKMVSLKEKFDEKNGIEIKDYSKKLNRFLNRKLKKESDLLLKQHLFLTLIPLAIQNRKV